MSSTTPNLGLVKLAGTDNFSNANALAGNWDKIDTALASKQYNLGALTNSTIADQAIAFANAHKGENGFVGAFYLSASTSSDLPAATNEWKYAFGQFRVRMSPQSGGADGEIVLYGFNTNNICIRSFANGTVNASWTQLPPKNDYVTKTTAWLAADERTDSPASCVVQTYGKIAVLNITTSSRAHVEDNVLGTIESGFRPIATTYAPCYAGGQAGWVRITTDGQIEIWLLPSGTAASRIYTTVTYVMA